MSFPISQTVKILNLVEEWDRKPIRAGLSHLKESSGGGWLCEFRLNLMARVKPLTSSASNGGSKVK